MSYKEKLQGKSEQQQTYWSLQEQGGGGSGRTQPDVEGRGGASKAGGGRGA